MKRSDLNYIAGFFDGEGCVSIHRGRVAIRIGQKDPSILENIQGLMGIGRIYQRRDREFHTLVIYRKADVGRFIRLIYPYVRGPKRAQLRQGYSTLKAE